MNVIEKKSKGVPQTSTNVLISIVLVSPGTRGGEGRGGEKVRSGDEGGGECVVVSTRIR